MPISTIASVISLLISLRKASQDKKDILLTLDTLLKRSEEIKSLVDNKMPKEVDKKDKRVIPSLNKFRHEYIEYLEELKSAIFNEDKNVEDVMRQSKSLLEKLKKSQEEFPDEKEIPPEYTKEVKNVISKCIKIQKDKLEKITTFLAIQTYIYNFADTILETKSVLSKMFTVKTKEWLETKNQIDEMEKILEES